MHDSLITIFRREAEMVKGRPASADLHDFMDRLFALNPTSNGGYNRDSTIPNSCMLLHGKPCDALQNQATDGSRGRKLRVLGIGVTVARLTLDQVV